MRAALILAFGAAIAVQAQPVQRPTFRAAARLVQISVVVQDNGGRPVTGLAASDFRVTENGQDQATRSSPPNRGASRHRWRARWPPQRR